MYVCVRAYVYFAGYPKLIHHGSETAEHYRPEKCISPKGIIAKGNRFTKGT